MRRRKGASTPPHRQFGSASHPVRTQSSSVAWVLHPWWGGKQWPHPGTRSLNDAEGCIHFRNSQGLADDRRQVPLDSPLLHLFPKYWPQHNGRGSCGSPRCHTLWALIKLLQPVIGLMLPQGQFPLDLWPPLACTPILLCTVYSDFAAASTRLVPPGSSRCNMISPMISQGELPGFCVAPSSSLSPQYRPETSRAVT